MNEIYSRKFIFNEAQKRTSENKQRLLHISDVCNEIRLFIFEELTQMNNE